jgi:hypothetical protein
MPRFKLGDTFLREEIPMRILKSGLWLRRNRAVLHRCLAFGVAFIFVVMGTPSGRAQQESAKTPAQWTYRVVDIAGNPGDEATSSFQIQEFLNARGKEGWELVTIELGVLNLKSPAGSPQYIQRPRLYLKRRLVQ